MRGLIDKRMRSPNVNPIRRRLHRQLFLLLCIPVAAPPAVASLPQAVGATGLSPDSLERMAENATTAVVVVRAETTAGPRQGSGFLVDPSGTIVTNFHVVRQARSASVVLASGDVYDRVELRASDERRDLAILQIHGYGLPTLPLGNSDSVRVGSPVIAIGSPLGLQNTVSTGIVSGRREREGFRLLQVTAPSSPGSSGGPVLSTHGDVIGVAVSQLRDGQNLNFAVPINYVRGMLAHLGEGPATALAPSSAGALMAADARPRGVGLALDFSDFEGYRLETQGPVGTGRWRRSWISYRRIETLGSDEPRIERYEESETIQYGSGFETPAPVERSRSRAIALADGLRPLSAQGEVSWRTLQNGWRSVAYDLRFDEGRVRGTITDSIGARREVSQELPTGAILRPMRDLAFGALASDSLSGRSVEFATYDPRTARLETDRYDVIGKTTIGVLGQTHAALRAELASGLSNSTAYFRFKAPHVLLRRDGEGGESMEEAVRIEPLTPSGGDGG